MLLYTSLTADVFDVLTRLLERFELEYYNGWRVESLSTADQLLMTLMKLKLNCRDLDLAERFGVSSATVANIIKTFVTALHDILVDGIISDYIPSQLKCAGSMPKSFEDFGNARIVIDATEITVDIPSQLDKQANCYSSYKGRHTVKFVTGVAPNSSVVFCSKAYPGSTSDVAIIEHCKVLDKLDAGDLILADKGFTIHSILPQGVSLNIPPFLRGKSQFTAREAQMCRKIARARIHVERANERIKNFEILSHIPHNYRSFATKIFQLCTCLINLQAPLLKAVTEDYTAKSTSDTFTDAV